MKTLWTVSKSSTHLLEVSRFSLLTWPYNTTINVAPTIGRSRSSFKKAKNNLDALTSCVKATARLIKAKGRRFVWRLCVTDVRSSFRKTRTVFIANKFILTRPMMEKSGLCVNNVQGGCILYVQISTQDKTQTQYSSALSARK